MTVRDISFSDVVIVLIKKKKKKYRVRSQGSWAKHDLRKTMCWSQMIFNNIIMTCVKATLIP